jgi:hypothetical protein
LSWCYNGSEAMSLSTEDKMSTIVRVTTISFMTTTMVGFMHLRNFAWPQPNNFCGMLIGENGYEFGP